MSFTTQKKKGLFFDSDEEEEGGLKKNKSLFKDDDLNGTANDVDHDVEAFKAQRKENLQTMQTQDEENVKASEKFKAAAAAMLNNQATTGKATATQRDNIESKSILSFLNDGDDDEDERPLTLGDAVQYETDESKQIKTEFSAKQRETAALLEEEDDIERFTTVVNANKTNTAVKPAVAAGKVEEKKKNTLDKSLFGDDDDDEGQVATPFVPTTSAPTTSAPKSTTTAPAKKSTLDMSLFGDDDGEDNTTTTKTDLGKIDDDFDFAAYLKNNQ